MWTDQAVILACCVRRNRMVPISTSILTKLASISTRWCFSPRCSAPRQLALLDRYTVARHQRCRSNRAFCKGCKNLRIRSCWTTQRHGELRRPVQQRLMNRRTNRLSSLNVHFQCGSALEWTICLHYHLAASARRQSTTAAAAVVPMPGFLYPWPATALVICFMSA